MVVLRVESSNLESVEDFDDSAYVGHGGRHDRHLKVTLKVSEASRSVRGYRRRLVLKHVMSHVLA